MLEITQRLQVADFYREAHQVIYRCICAIEQRGEPVDIITVSAELRKRNALDAVGGAEYLDAIISDVPTTRHATRYAAIVLDNAVKRRVIETASNIQARAYDPISDPVSVIGESLGTLELLQERCESADTPKLVADRDGEWDRIEQRRLRPYEISTARFGIPDLDRRIGGLEDAGFAIIMGDTGMGKSSLLRQIVLSTALQVMADQDPGVVVLYAMEESGWRWRQRSVGWLGGFNTRALDNAAAWEREIRQNPMVEEDYKNATVIFDQLPLMVAGGAQTIDTIEAHCRRITRTRPIRMVGLDYLQRITKDDSAYGNEERAWRDVSWRLCRLRDKLGCPIVGPSQISKGPDGQHHTFGARAFYHDADLVVEIHRAKLDTGGWQEDCQIESQKTREIAGWGKFACRTSFPTGQWYAVDLDRESTAE